MCEGQGTASLPWLSHPHKCPVGVFPFRPSLCQFGFIWDAFTFVGRAGDSRVWVGTQTHPHNPSPRAKMRRGTPSLSLFIVLFFFSIFCAFMFLSWDAGLGMSSPDPAFRGCCIPLEQIRVPQGLQGSWAGLIITASLCNSKGFGIKTPNPPVLAPACCSVAGGSGLSAGIRR